MWFRVDLFHWIKYTVTLDEIYEHLAGNVTKHIDWFVMIFEWRLMVHSFTINFCKSHLLIGKPLSTLIIIHFDLPFDQVDIVHAHRICQLYHFKSNDESSPLFIHFFRKEDSNLQNIIPNLEDTFSYVTSSNWKYFYQIEKRMRHTSRIYK